VLRLDDDETYRLSGSELEARVSVAPWEADAGTKVDVKTARGLVSLSVPAGSRTGKRLRLRGQGLDDGRGGRGDCIVRVELDLPATLTERQRELLRELGAQPGAAVSGGARTGGAS
jgi:curved DNA-binding protein